MGGEGQLLRLAKCLLKTSAKESVKRKKERRKKKVAQRPQYHIVISPMMNFDSDEGLTPFFLFSFFLLTKNWHSLYPHTALSWKTSPYARQNRSHLVAVDTIYLRTALCPSGP
jgi:hypothetical protein